MVERIEKKILITGAAGMLGKALISRFNDRFCVIALDLNPVKENNSSIVFCPADICNLDALNGIFHKYRPEIVIHAAAYTDVDGCENKTELAYRINGQGTQNIACLCKQIKAKLIYTSTDYVFDGSKGGAYREDDPPNPLNVYGRSKLEGEKAVARTIAEYLIVRTSWLFGAGGKNFVDTIIDKAGKGEQLKVVNDQIGSPTHTESLAQAIEKLIGHIFQKNKRNAYGIYHITNSGTCSWFEFAREIIDLSKTKAQILPLSSTEFARSAQRPAISILDNSRYNEITGHSLCSWQEALKQYIIKKRGEA